MYIDGKGVGGPVEDTTVQEDGWFMTIVVDGDRDIVVGEFRDIVKGVDGATEVSIYCQYLVCYYIQLEFVR